MKMVGNSEEIANIIKKGSLVSGHRFLLGLCGSVLAHPQVPRVFTVFNLNVKVGGGVQIVTYCNG